MTVGLTELDAVSQAMLYHARALIPYAPVHLEALRHSSGDIGFSWKRRTRGQGEWRDGVEVPLNEASERYGLEVWVGATMIRQTQLSVPQYSYSNSQQIADNGSPLSAFELRVWQVSDMVGKGYVGIKSFSF